MIDWKLAPSGANELVRNGFRIAYRDDAGNVYMSTGWEYIESWDLAEVIATRPTQTKTVADAYIALKDMIPDNDKNWTHVRYEPKNDEIFFAYGEMDDQGWEHSYIVCTRAEFEAYVKEQEGDKWTHELWGDKAYIKISEPDCDGYMLVITEGNRYNLAKMEDLKPIKPSLTKAEAWDLCQDYEGHKSMKKYMYDLHEQYDII